MNDDEPDDALVERLTQTVLRIPQVERLFSARYRAAHRNVYLLPSDVLDAYEHALERGTFQDMVAASHKVATALQAIDHQRARPQISIPQGTRSVSADGLSDN